MFKPQGYDGVEAKNFQNDKLGAGPYVGVITFAEEKQSKNGNQMLVLNVDIAEGPFKGNYAALSQRLAKDCYLKHYRVLSEDNAGYLKGDILAIEHSNQNFKYDFEEKSLIGKFVGINLREEEYFGNTGEIKSNVKILHLCSASDVRKGAIKAPKPKTVQRGAPNVDDSIPF
jgi:hypothetical protein